MDGVDLKDHPQTTITTQPPSSHTKICAHMFFHGFKLTTLTTSSFTLMWPSIYKWKS
jgi:hypothetical protein